MENETIIPVRNSQTTLWWISSLAISVVCCAVLFVVFASYLVDINKNIAVFTATTNVRLQTLEERQNQMSTDIETLRRHSVQQIQIIPPNPPAAAPVTPSVNPPPAPAPAPVKKK